MLTVERKEVNAHARSDHLDPTLEPPHREERVGSRAGPGEQRLQRKLLLLIDTGAPPGEAFLGRGLPPTLDVTRDGKNR